MTNDEVKLAQQIGHDMKVQRFFAEITQVQLAKKAGVSQSTVAQIEAGNKLPSTTTLWKIEKILGPIWHSPGGQE